MSIKDLIVFLIYIAGNILVSFILSKKIKNSADFFAAGRSSTWWLSGLSAFMTMFSAGTFVVWGGIAFRYGMVAVSISMCLGISAFLVGNGIAQRWRRLGITTAAEYINLRFGPAVLQFYTWFNIAFRLLNLGVALYSVSVILDALLPGGLRQFLGSITFNSNAVIAIIVFCGIVIITYAITGGLWSVIITNVLQFLVLMVAVSVVVPLGFMKIGGMGEFINKAPEGFFSPVTSEFTWIFLAGWVVIHYLKIGGEWAFIQQNIAVPTPRDAKKASYLFGAMYLISPMLWMLPPMMYRIVDPSANYEQAYILACQYALPSGLIGLMAAAMFSATASSIEAELNVFAGVLTRDIYRKKYPDSTEERQIFIGRFMTFLIGILVMSIAILVPRMGGADEIILAATALISGPMIMPVIWGVYSKKITGKSIFTVILVSSVVSILLKFGFFIQNGWFIREYPTPFVLWLQSNSRTIETLIGLFVPFFILLTIELTRNTKSSRYVCSNKMAEQEKPVNVKASLFPPKIVGWSLIAIAILFFVLAISERETLPILLGYGAGLTTLGVLILFWVHRIEKKLT